MKSSSGWSRRFRWLPSSLLFASLCVLLFSAQAGAPGAAQGQGALVGGRRLALLIGNSAYQKRPLANPANDAADLGALL